MKHIKNISILLLLFWSVKGFSQLNPGSIGIVVTNEGTINTKQLDYSPAFYEDGVVFISNQTDDIRYRVKDKRINQNIMSIYWAKRDSNGILKKPVPFATELLSKTHEGPLTFDRTGGTIYFTRNNIVNGKKVYAKDGIVKLKIYSAVKVGNDWKDVQALPFNDNESNTVHPSISVEGDKLYFASDRPGGAGGMDLYVSHRMGEDWSAPINLGPNINTDKNEVFPFIHADGTLFFASGGHSGLGGLDIFMAASKGASFTPPVNLGDPFNSLADDFGLIIDRDKKNGYFSSNRIGSIGEDDVYNFYITGNLDLAFKGDLEKEEKRTKIWVKVLDAASGEPLTEAKVTALNLDRLNAAKIITDGNQTIATLLPSAVAENQMILQLAVDEGDPMGVTDREGRIPLILGGNKTVINVNKQSYQTSQLLVSQVLEGEELTVFLEKATGCIALKGKVIDSGNNPIVGAEVIIMGDAGMEEQRIVVDRSGAYEYCLARNKRYEVLIKQGENIIAQKMVSTKDSEGRQSMPLSMVINGGEEQALPIKEGSIIELPNIYYNFNDAAIRPDAKKDLDVIISVLKNYPEMEIELASHTDSRGGTRYNKQLSQKRAENVVEYLLSKGVDPSKVQPVGYGETDLRNNCSDNVRCSEREHQYNRRTEVRVTKFNQPGPEVKFVNTDPNPEEFFNNSPAVNNKIGGQRVVDESNYFLVIAGAYGVLSNARDKLEKIKNLGYQDAQIVELGGSNLKLVQVGTFDDGESARGLVESLRDKHQIHAYVKRMRN